MRLITAVLKNCREAEGAQHCVGHGREGRCAGDAPVRAGLVPRDQRSSGRRRRLLPGRSAAAGGRKVAGEGWGAGRAGRGQLRTRPLAAERAVRCLFKSFGGTKRTRQPSGSLLSGGPRGVGPDGVSLPARPVCGSRPPAPLVRRSPARAPEAESRGLAGSAAGGGWAAGASGKEGTPLLPQLREPIPAAPVPPAAPAAGSDPPAQRQAGSAEDRRPGSPGRPGLRTLRSRLCGKTSLRVAESHLRLPGPERSGVHWTGSEE
ncbi:hypothetical protein J1605_006425 [Eschrichtius robustus]|uniref:Uncharacterized protein n=1 Tax=Eschrichtius robustus TaxID=9764 RepID=A0AB34H5M6_ESCRO|nr:hypothetical protein J1605_006425 [Eschrichtius robustus]